MEELVLTEPETEPAKTKSSYKVTLLTMNHEFVMPPETIPGLVLIQLRDNLGGVFVQQYTGQTAKDYMKFVNTGNFSTKSLHKRILERLSNEGVFPEQSQAPQMPQMEMTLEDFYQIVGELEVVRRKQLQIFMKQINEMSVEISRLRAENGKLVQTDNNE